MDALVASYSQLVKLGNALVGGDRRASEKSQHSDIQHAVSSEVSSEEPVSNMVNREKSVGQHYSSESQKSAEREMKNESLDNASSSATIKESIPSGSNFERDANFENLRHDNSLSGDRKKREVVRTMGSQISGVNLEKSPLESGADHNNNVSEASVSTQIGPQHVSVAISPDEIYHSVLAVVEDEMGGDFSDLVSVIVEFLRRCAVQFAL